jgi:2-polyprenyl-3-methyl-5-hydroxy-6-metoxy-1,4-benzoquinol methylase
MTMTASLDSFVVAGTCCQECGHDVWSVQFMGLTDYLTDETFGVHRCMNCQLMVTQPLPISQDIGRYYPPRYRGDRHAFTGKLRTTLRARAIEKCFPKNFRGRLLDIGCGDGSFAREMKSRGWDVSATEIDPDVIQRLASEGIDARLSPQAMERGFEQKFDAITTWHVLEHVENPRQTLEWIRGQLADGGAFQATVPNAGCIQAKVLGRHWIHLDVPRHRQHFTAATLRAMLESAKFKVEKRANFAWEYDLFGVIQSALNMVCAKPNVLFDKLTHAQVDPAKPASIVDTVVSFALAPGIAAISLPLLGTLALLGDGATLTYTCRV